MKSIFYLLTILFLSLLISCSEEPPTNVELETLSKKPVPPDPPPALILLPGETHIIGEVRERNRGKYTESFRVWSNPPKSDDPQIREIEGTQIKVAIYNYIDESPGDELLVYHYYKTGKKNNEVEHFELQIWEDGNIETPSLVYDLEGLLYLDIAIGELDGDLGNGDEIVIGGYNTLLGYPEIRVINPLDGGFEDPIKTFNVNAYGMFGRPIAIGDVEGDEANEIIFQCLVRRLAVLDYNSGLAKTYDTNEQLNQIAVGYVDGGLDEIIWGGLSGEIHILEFDGITETFSEKWESVNLGGQIWSLAAGDFDSDPEYEIAVSTLSSGNPSTIYVFDYDPSSPNPPYAKNELDVIPEGVISMFAGNANNNPVTKKGLVVGTRTSVKSYYTTPLFNVDIGAIVPEVYIR